MARTVLDLGCALLILGGVNTAIAASSTITAETAYSSSRVNASRSPSIISSPLISSAFEIVDINNVTRSTSFSTKPLSRYGMVTSSRSWLSTTSRPSNDSNGDCYSSWSVYWAASQVSYNASKTYYAHGNTLSPTETTTQTVFETFSAYPASTYLNTITEDYTSYEVDGGFTISTSVVDLTSTYAFSYSSQPASTYSYTTTKTKYATALPSLISVPAIPTCTLPSVVPACQSSWEKWVSTQLAPSPTPPPHCDLGAGILNNRTVPACATSYSSTLKSWYTYVGGFYQSLGTPACKAASISGALCQSVRDNYQMSENGILWPSITQYGQVNPFFFNQGTQGFYNGINSTWIWPTSSTMGAVPSCTLGCGRCAVTGGTVQLLYWATSATPAPVSGNYTGLAGSSSQSLTSPTATATGPGTVVTLGTTLTSPTLYISYGSVYAENACGGIGTTIQDYILAIPTDSTLSSVYASTIPCDAHFRPTQVQTYTAPFTIGDLNGNNGSVPYSIYSSQPVCQSYLRAHNCQGICPTTAPYKPIIVVPNQLLRELQPSWADCWGDIRGVYDPPIALTAAQNAASATDPFATTTAAGYTPTSATPASGPAPNTASPTTSNAPSALSQVLPSATDSAVVISILRSALPPQQQPTSAKTSGDLVEQTSSNNAESLVGVATSSPSQPQPVVIGSGSQALTILQIIGTSSSAVAIANGGSTTTLSIGAVASISGQQISVADSGAVVLGTGNAAATIAEPPILASGQIVATIGSQMVTLSQVDGDGAVVVAQGGTSATLEAGTLTSINGEQISVGSGGTVILGTGSAASTVTAPNSENQAQIVITLGSHVATISQITGGSSVVVAENGQTATLAAGGSAVTIGGQQVSAAGSGSVILGSGTTATTISVPRASTAATPMVSSSMQTFTFLETGSNVVIAQDGVTASLAPNSVTTINGQRISLGSSGVVVIGTGSTARTIAATTAAASGPGAFTTTIGMQALTISELPGGSSVVIAELGTTRTVAVGSTIVVGGETISVGPPGIVVVKSGSSFTSITVPSAVSGTALTTTSSPRGTNKGSTPLPTTSRRSDAARPGVYSSILVICYAAFAVLGMVFF